MENEISADILKLHSFAYNFFCSRSPVAYRWPAFALAGPGERGAKSERTRVRRNRRTMWMHKCLAFSFAFSLFHFSSVIIPIPRDVIWRGKSPPCDAVKGTYSRICIRRRYFEHFTHNLRRRKRNVHVPSSGPVRVWRATKGTALTVTSIVPDTLRSARWQRSRSGTERKKSRH